MIKFLLDMEKYFQSGGINVEMKKIMIQVDSLTLDENNKCTLACMFLNEFDEESHRKKHLQLLGGQTHI